MKWKNKEHEFDGIYSKYDDMLKDKKGISIFGCGEIGAFYSDVTIRSHYETIREYQLHNQNTSLLM